MLTGWGISMIDSREIPRSLTEGAVARGDRAGHGRTGPPGEQDHRPPRAGQDARLGLADLAELGGGGQVGDQDRERPEPTPCTIPSTRILARTSPPPSPKVQQCLRGLA